MNKALTEIERLRLDNFLLLYQLEYADESSCLPGGDTAPTASEMAGVLRQQDIDIDESVMQLILDQKQAISDELADAIEKAYMMTPGWLSQE
jgi:hypothetical protein